MLFCCIVYLEKKFVKSFCQAVVIRSFDKFFFYSCMFSRVFFFFQKMSDESANSKNGKGKIGRRRPHTLLHKRPVGSVAFFFVSHWFGRIFHGSHRKIVLKTMILVKIKLFWVSKRSQSAKSCHTVLRASAPWQQVLYLKNKKRAKIFEKKPTNVKWDKFWHDCYFAW